MQADDEVKEKVKEKVKAAVSEAADVDAIQELKKDVKVALEQVKNIQMIKSGCLCTECALKLLVFTFTPPGVEKMVLEDVLQCCFGLFRLCVCMHVCNIRPKRHGKTPSRTTFAIGTGNLRRNMLYLVCEHVCYVMCISARVPCSCVCFV